MQECSQACIPCDLRELLFDQIAAAEVPELVREFVLAAFDGAEALAAVLVGGAYSAELVLTGENLRWSAERHNQTLWRDGWRNLHETGEVEIGIDLVAAGVPSLITVPHDVGGRSKPRRWSHGN